MLVVWCIIDGGIILYGSFVVVVRKCNYVQPFDITSSSSIHCR